jgi:hypothetical protein
MYYNYTDLSFIRNEQNIQNNIEYLGNNPSDNQDRPVIITAKRDMFECR